MTWSDLAAEFAALLDEHPDLGRTTWTREQIQALELVADMHTEDCEECEEKFARVPGFLTDDWEKFDWGDFEYCPIGETLMAAALDADLEWSWQPDFPDPELPSEEDLQLDEDDEDEDEEENDAGW